MDFCIYPKMTDLRVAELGFPPLKHVESLESIAHIIRNPRKRCGIYLLEFNDSFHYIGQSLNVVRRYSEHRKNHMDIEGFSFLQTARVNLDQTEQELIFRAERLGFHLRNTVHSTEVTGETDLDLILPVDQQERWVKDPASYEQSNPSPRVTFPKARQGRFGYKFLKFQHHPLSEEASLLLREYLLNCVPSPRLTEYVFWAVSCMPSTSNEYRRLFCINAAMMEAFVVGEKRGEPGSFWSFINVAGDVLLSQWGSLEAVLRSYPLIEIEKSVYRDAGNDQLSLKTEDLETMRAMVADQRITRPAGALVLRVMRKRATIYGKYHCPQLAGLALG